MLPVSLLRPPRDRAHELQPGAVDMGLDDLHQPPGGGHTCDFSQKGVEAVVMAIEGQVVVALAGLPLSRQYRLETRGVERCRGKPLRNLAFEGAAAEHRLHDLAHIHGSNHRTHLRPGLDQILGGQTLERGAEGRAAYAEEGGKIGLHKRRLGRQPVVDDPLAQQAVDLSDNGEAPIQIGTGERLPDIKTRQGPFPAWHLHYPLLSGPDRRCSRFNGVRLAWPVPRRRVQQAKPRSRALPPDTLDTSIRLNLLPREETQA